MSQRAVRFSVTALILLVAALVPRAGAATIVAGGNLGNQTWTPAGNPYVVSGDITVQAGATLMIQSGTDVQFLAGDTQASGGDTSRIEVTVNGELVVFGTAAHPVTFELQAGQSGSWYGIVIGAGAVAAVIENASISGTIYAITSEMIGAPLVVSQTSIQNAVDAGVYVYAGGAMLDALTIGVAGGSNNPTYGLLLTNGLPALNEVSVGNTVIAGCAFNVLAGPGNVGVDISSSTLDGGFHGVYVTGPDPRVTLRNSIVTNHAQTGVDAPMALQLVATYSDVWNNGTDYAGPETGTTNISANPQFVGTSDYHLQAGSACIDSGTTIGAPVRDHDGTTRPLDGDGVNGAAFDMGAYEYDPGGAAGRAGAGGAAGSAGAGGAAGASGAAGGPASASGTAGAAGAAGASGAAGIGGAGDSTGAAGAGGGAGAPGTAGASETAGAGGAAGKAGTAGASGGLGAAGTTGTGGGGCGCETGGAPTSAWGLALAFVAIVLRRRRHA